MSESQNGYSAVPYGSPMLHRWVIPSRTGRFTISLRRGSAGFVLAHLLLWLSEEVEPNVGPVLDDWGHAPRTVRGYTTTLSNHASGTAFDSNALRHVMGQRGTYDRRDRRAILTRLRWRAYGGAIRWGGTYDRRPDEMHYELVRDLPAVERIARRLMATPRGVRLLRANPGQARVILS